MALYLIVAQNLCIFTGFIAARVMLSLYALQPGATPSDVGVVVAMFYIFPLLLSWPVGALLDRFGSRWLLLSGSGFGPPITMMLTFSHSAEGQGGEVLGVRLTVPNLMRVIGPAIFGTMGSGQWVRHRGWVRCSGSAHS